jgi:hypothetical protein
LEGSELQVRRLFSLPPSPALSLSCALFLPLPPRLFTDDLFVRRIAGPECCKAGTSSGSFLSSLLPFLSSPLPPSIVSLFPLFLLLTTPTFYSFSGGGIVEVNIRLPGANDIGGLWPGAWTMGNLGRAGYGATNDGTWPYSYSSCDIGALSSPFSLFLVHRTHKKNLAGTLPNQTTVDGKGPAAALNSGDKSVKGSLSYQPGQRLSFVFFPSFSSFFLY